MKLKDLLKNTDFEACFNVINSNYSDQENNKLGYENVFNKLLELSECELPKTDFYIYIRLEEDFFDKQKYICISLVDGSIFDNNEENHISKHKIELKEEGNDFKTLVTYSISFVEWAEFLNMPIIEYKTNQFKPEEIVGHCLFEMTFYGFDEKTIKKESDKLEKLSESL